ncbi:hypothetical protein EGW08_007348, partial [Elysia chlorotica]
MSTAISSSTTATTTTSTTDADSNKKDKNCNNSIASSCTDSSACPEETDPFEGDCNSTLAPVSKPTRKTSIGGVVCGTSRYPLHSQGGGWSKRRCGLCNVKFTSCPHVLRAPTVIAMVGLPARGKTYISKKLTRYLNWIGVSTKVFNVGEYRRARTDKYRNHEFFKSNNTQAQELRSRVAMLAMEDAAKF